MAVFNTRTPPTRAMLRALNSFETHPFDLSLGSACVASCLNHVGQLVDLGQHAAELGDAVDFYGDVEYGDVILDSLPDGCDVDVFCADDGRDFAEQLGAVVGVM